MADETDQFLRSLYQHAKQDGEDPEDVAQRIWQNNRGVSRRELLAGGGALGLGAAMGGGGAMAATNRAAADNDSYGDVGTDGDPVDAYLDQVYDVNNNAAMSFPGDGSVDIDSLGPDRKWANAFIDDGSASDILDAIQQAAAALPTNGGFVFVESGQYTASTTCDLSQTVLGRDQPVWIRSVPGSNEQADNGASIDVSGMTSGQAVFKLSDGNPRANIRIDGLKVDDGNNNVDAFKVNGGNFNRLVLHRTLVNGARSGIRAEGDIIRARIEDGFWRNNTRHIHAVSGSGASFNVWNMRGGQFKSAAQYALDLEANNLNSFRAFTEFNNNDGPILRLDMDVRSCQLNWYGESNNSGSNEGIITVAGNAARDLEISARDTGGNGPFINVESGASLNALDIHNSYIDVTGELFASAGTFRSASIEDSELRSTAATNIGAPTFLEMDGYTDSTTLDNSNAGQRRLRKYNEMPRYDAYQVRSSAPTAPFTGMVAAQDGTNWNPTGSGNVELVIYNGSSFVSA